MDYKKWETSTLSLLCTKIGSGATPRGGKETYQEEGPYALIRSQNVLDFFFSKEGLAFITEDQAAQLNNVDVKERDVLLNITGDSVARVCQASAELLPARVNQHVSIIRPDTSKLIPEFLKYYLLNPKFKNYMLGLASVGGTRNALTKGMIEDFIVRVPPLPTQHHIAEILSALDDKIELNRQTNATLEAIAQTIFKEWFVDFNFPGATGELVESELGLIPKMWRVVQLGEVSDLSWGDTKTTKNSYSSEGYIAYSASGPDGYLPYYDFSRDGIVVSAIGAYSGKTWFAHGYWSCIKNTIRFWSTDDNLSNEYLYLYTSPKGFWPLRGSAQPFISQTDAREKRIIYPGNHLARDFGEVLQPLFQLIRRNDDEAFTLSQTRDSLLPKLMNGEIEV